MSKKSIIAPPPPSLSYKETCKILFAVGFMAEEGKEFADRIFRAKKNLPSADDLKILLQQIARDHNTNIQGACSLVQKDMSLLFPVPAPPPIVMDIVSATLDVLADWNQAAVDKALETAPISPALTDHAPRMARLKTGTSRPALAISLSYGLGTPC